MKLWTQYLLTGPVQPSGGKFWSLKFYGLRRLAFCKEGIVAIPANLMDSLVLGAAAGMGAAGRAALGVATRAASAKLGAGGHDHAAQTLHDDGNEKWFRYELDEIDRIETHTSQLGAHYIIVEPSSGKPMTYGVQIRSDWDTYERMLRRLYRDKVECVSGWF